MDRAELLALIDKAAEEGWKKLDLSGKRLTELPPEIGKLTQLRVLILGKWNRKNEVYEGNYLTELPEEIGRLENLTALYVSSNRITELPESISNLTKLEALFVQDNNLSEIPAAIAQLQELRTLNLEDNRCQALPEWISQLNKLWWLNLNNNALTQLSESIGSLNHLRQLSLKKNSLAELPDALGKLTQLKILGLGDMQLAELPEWISQLSSLRQLYIWKNPLSELPEWITSLTNLRIFDIEGLKLLEIPDWIGQLNKLNKLDLSNNRLTELPNSLAQLTKLKRLDLDNNQFNRVPEWIGVLVGLEKLFLHNNRLTAVPRFLSQLINLKRLDLDDNQFTEVPEWLGQLTELKEIYLNNNQLTTVPDSLAQLTKLEKFYLWGNQFTEVPEWLGQLLELKDLQLSNNQLTTVPGSLAQLTKLEAFNLYDNQFTEVPEWLGQLTELKDLRLSKNQLTTVPDSLAQLTKLERLYLWDNQLTEVPEWLGQLTELKDLRLSKNQLTTVPDSLAQLTKLEAFNLYDNQFTEVPEWLGQLTELKDLRLSKNQLTTVPGSLGQLTKLEKFYLSSNQFTEVPEWLGQLTELKDLRLSKNQLTTVPNSSAQLTKLEKFYLNNNQFTEVPEWLGQLSELKELYLWNNPLTEVPECIGELRNLKILDLDGLNLIEVPKCLSGLLNLQELDLRNNQLTDLPEWLQKITKLKKLNLSNNHLKKLSVTLQSLANLEELKLQGNPLPIPPEILNSKEPKKPKEILDFYFSAQQDPVSAKLYEAKMLVVGEGGAGKTSLAKKIQDDQYELQTSETTTEGIDVIRWKFDQPDSFPFRVNMWDFGGQEIYHSTHQFFLTKRSLYILVADARKVDTDFYYWLKVIELLSDNSPVIIVKNEKQDRQCEINERQLRGEFTNLQKVLSTNLENNRGLDGIKDAIQKQVIDLPHVGTVLPGIWVKVRSVLENYGENCNHITVEEYCDLCKLQGFTDKTQMLSLSGYLHDLGVCLHFQDDKLLKKTVILKPEWGTTAVYKVFDNKKVQANLGHFTDEDLIEIWSDKQYADMRDELLQLMMKFKLCYEIPNEKGTYIAPSLLSINQPDYNWNENENLILRFEYEFMPKGILTRFIVEMHEQIENSLVWKNGVVVANAWARAEIIEYYRYHKGEIRIRISGKSKKSLLFIVIHELEKIHASYERLRYKAFIPCNCKYCNGHQSPHGYAFETLIQFINDGQTTIQCQKSYEMVNVRRLIDDVTDTPPPPRKYAGYDVAHETKGRWDDDSMVQDRINDMMATQPMLGKMPDHMVDAVHSPAQGINFFFPFNISQEASMGNTYNQYGKGDNIAGDQVQGDKIGTQINNNQDLAQAAQDIKALLDQLSDEYDPASPVGQAMINAKAIEAVSKDNTLKQRVVKALKSAGDEALEQAIQHPVAKVFVAGAKSFIEG